MTRVKSLWLIFSTLALMNWHNIQATDESKSCIHHPIHYPATSHAIRLHRWAYYRQASLNPSQLSHLNPCEKLFFKLELLRDLKGTKRELKKHLKKEGFTKIEIARQLDLPRLTYRKELLERELRHHVTYPGSWIFGFLNNPVRQHRAISEGHAALIEQELKTIDDKLTGVKIPHEATHV